MPRLTQTESWVIEFRKLLYGEFDKGHQWSVGEHRGYMRLQVKHNGGKQTRLLPYEWSRNGASKAISEIKQIVLNQCKKFCFPLLENTRPPKSKFFNG